MTRRTASWRNIAVIVSLLVSYVFGMPPRILAEGRVLQVCQRACAFYSIATALGQAQAGDVILVGPGSYLEHIELRAGVTIRGAGSNITIITGDNAGTVIRAYGASIDRTTVVEEVTIRYGKAFAGGGIDIRGGASPTIRNNLITENASGSNESYGGGMFISGGSPLITGNVFTKNQSSWGGGAIAVWDESTAVITNNHFEANKAYQYGGGISVAHSSPTISGNTIISNTAYYGGGVDLSDSSPEFANNVIMRNTAWVLGGGVYLRNHSSPSIFANTFMTNTSSFGAGLFMDQSSPTVTGNTFQYNDSDTGGAIYVSRSSPLIARNLVAFNVAWFHGGGIHIKDSSPTVDNNNITGNTATIAGGGLGIVGHSQPIIQNNTIADNAVGLYGGAAYIEVAAPGLINNMIVRNSSGQQGGGVYVQNAAPLLQNNTIAYNNQAGNGEGVYLTGSSCPTITNNIIAGNNFGIVAATGPAYPAEAFVITHNDVWSNRSGDFVGVASKQNLSVDPLFISGREGHYYLSQVSAGQTENSPALDAGNAPAGDLGLDQRTTAVQDLLDDGVVDMGFHYRALTHRTYLPIILDEY